MARPRTLLALSALGASVACSLLTDLNPLGGPADGSAVDVAPPEAPIDGFVLTATPAHVTQDPGDSTDVSVSIIRGSAFTDIVDVTVNGVGGLSGTQTSPASLALTGSAPVTLHIDIAATAKVPQDGFITLLGIGRTTQKSSSTTFGVRIGSVILDTTTSTAFTIPSYARTVTIKAWGAGGAPGVTTADSQNNAASGGTGGGGGLSAATFDVGNLGPLTILVGAPGADGSRSSGSGGGYTNVAVAGGPLLVAGGGGGGGVGGSTADAYCSAFNGGNGAAGGGGKPQNAKNSATADAGGPAGDSVATAGASLQGGDGAPTGSCGQCKYVDGGAPGGGRGATGGNCGGASGGGGGGGWYGGGGGGKWTTAGSPFGVTNGGGGGSGFVSDAGVDALQLAGNGTIPGGVSDPDYAPGTASGGAPAGSAAAVPATPGRVVVRAGKP